MLKRIPSVHDFERLYYELAKIGAPSIGAQRAWPYRFKTKEELLALALDMTRYDPRLLGILIIYFKNLWNSLNPLHFRQEILKCETPQVMGVIGEFVKKETKDKEVYYFFEYLTKGLSRVSWQLFFIGTYPFGSPQMERGEKRGLKEYKKWGFLSSEKPVVDLKTKRQAGSFDQKSRLQILDSMLKRNRRITLKDYLEAIDHTITRQQALIDLKSVKGLKMRGHGRGAFWSHKGH